MSVLFSASSLPPLCFDFSPSFLSPVSLPHFLSLKTSTDNTTHKQLHCCTNCLCTETGIPVGWDPETETQTSTAQCEPSHGSLVIPTVDQCPGVCLWRGKCVCMCVLICVRLAELLLSIMTVRSHTNTSTSPTLTHTKYHPPPLLTFAISLNANINISVPLYRHFLRRIRTHTDTLSLCYFTFKSYLGYACD